MFENTLKILSELHNVYAKADEYSLSKEDYMLLDSEELDTTKALLLDNEQFAIRVAKLILVPKALITKSKQR